MAIGQYVITAGDGVTWSRAREKALAQGGQLASLTTEAENVLVANVLLAAALNGTFQPAFAFWLGLSQLPSGPEPAGGWRWESGETFDYTNWLPGEPNNGFGTQNFGTIGRFDTLSFDTRSVGWDDLSENESRGYITEFSAQSVVLRGTTSFTTDVFVGGSIGNRIIGWLGNDIIDGGGGRDTVDYSALGQAVTLKSRGVIEKGSAGTDQILNVEAIIGARGKVNVIDGTVDDPSSQLTRFDINLGRKTFTVGGIPELGDQTFSVTNFVNVIGTNNDDLIVGDSAANNLSGAGGNDTLSGGGGRDTLVGGVGDDVYIVASTGVVVDEAEGAGTDEIRTSLGNYNLSSSNTIENLTYTGSGSFIGRGNDLSNVLTGGSGNDLFKQSAGADTFIGGDGFDVVDYTGAGAAFTLRSRGLVDFGGGGDQTFGIEGYIGDQDFRNAIDGTVDDAVQVTSFDVDLEQQRLTVKNVPGLGDADFTVINFLDVTGTRNDDVIAGSSDDNFLNGAEGDDILKGSGGADTLIGGGGIDLVDYTALSDAITLRSSGVIDKGANGIDVIAGIRGIIGALGQRNVIDGMTANAGPQPTSFDVDLGAGQLTVNGIPGLGSVSFALSNFTDVIGTVNADKIGGSADDNELIGQAGDDALLGSAGNDVLDGGDGRDTVDYSGLSSAVTLRSSGVIDKGDNGIDVITGIEVITGAAGQRNVIDGTTANAGPQPTSFDVDLAANRLTVNGVPGIGNVTFAVTNFTDVIGTANRDSIAGGQGSNALSGQAGDDVLFGSSGNDNLDGGDGSDTADYSRLSQAIILKSQGVVAKGAAGQDLLIGIERIVGAAGKRNVIDGATSATGPQPTSFTVDLSGGKLIVEGIPGLGSQTFQVANFTDVIGTANGDVLVGSAGSDLLDGRAGDDFLDGGAGADTLNGGDGIDFLRGGAGADRLDGGAGSDAAVYTSALAAVTIDRVTAANSRGDAAGDVFIGIEGFELTGFNDVFVGNAENEGILGGAGNDTLSGNAGNDFFRGGAGADRLDGGAGFDSTDYLDAAAAVTVDRVTAANSRGDAAGDVFIGIEQFGLSSFNDVFVGNSENENIVGAGGNDTLGGGAGSDILEGSVGADRLDGGLGFDVASYFGSLAGVVLDRTTPTNSRGDAAGDVFIGIEQFDLTFFNDVFVGNAENEAVKGLAGNDTLTGNAGNDFFDGGAGADRLDGGAGFDISSYASAGGAVTLDRVTAANSRGDAAGDIFTGIEQFELTAFNDVFVGNAESEAVVGGAGNDTVSGGAGVDFIVGGVGGDRLDGGADFDIASYASAAAAVTIDRVTAANSRGDAAGDVFIGIEQFELSAFNDVFVGNAENEAILGAAGNDTLNGGAGSDVLEGGAGNDQLTGGLNLDSFVIRQGFGRDTISDFGATAANQDILRFSTAVFANSTAVLTASRQSGTDVTITATTNDVLTLRNVTLASLDSADFQFFT
jgi:Ca2+-binding RTX toxin-like protein